MNGRNLLARMLGLSLFLLLVTCSHSSAPPADPACPCPSEATAPRATDVDQLTSTPHGRPLDDKRAWLQQCVARSKIVRERLGRRKAAAREARDIIALNEINSQRVQLEGIVKSIEKAAQSDEELDDLTLVRLEGLCATAIELGRQAELVAIDCTCE